MPIQARGSMLVNPAAATQLRGEKLPTVKFFAGSGSCQQGILSAEKIYCLCHHVSRAAPPVDPRQLICVASLRMKRFQFTMPANCIGPKGNR
jgi:hypothetical protein